MLNEHFRQLFWYGQIVFVDRIDYISQKRTLDQKTKQIDLSRLRPTD